MAANAALKYWAKLKFSAAAKYVKCLKYFDLGMTEMDTFYFFKVTESSWKATEEGTTQEFQMSLLKLFLYQEMGFPFCKVQTRGQIWSHLPSSYTLYT